jgi:hypothetical protein
MMSWQRPWWDGVYQMLLDCGRELQGLGDTWCSDHSVKFLLRKALGFLELPNGCIVIQSWGINRQDSAHFERQMLLFSRIFFWQTQNELESLEKVEDDSNSV